METLQLHDWNLSPADARRLQQELRDRLVLTDALRLEEVRRVAGVDNAYTRGEGGTTGHAAVVVLDYPAMEVVETRCASVPVSFPYVPGLLSFREAPAVLEALRQVESEPDVVLFDGHGYAHPRRLGLASHLGLLLDRPTVGCAKSRLVGRHEEPPEEPGGWAPLRDGDEVIGAALRTRRGHAPLYVSQGHRIRLETAVALVLACCREGRFLPEPTRLAHEAVGAYARPGKGRGGGGEVASSQ